MSTAQATPPARTTIRRWGYPCWLCGHCRSGGRGLALGLAELPRGAHSRACPASCWPSATRSSVSSPRARRTPSSSCSKERQAGPQRHRRPRPWRSPRSSGSARPNAAAGRRDPASPVSPWSASSPASAAGSSTPLFAAIDGHRGRRRGEGARSLLRLAGAHGASAVTGRPRPWPRSAKQEPVITPVPRLGRGLAAAGVAAAPSVGCCSTRAPDVADAEAAYPSAAEPAADPRRCGAGARGI